MSPELPPAAETDVTSRPGTAQGTADRALPIGTRLQEFEIIGLVGQGGFGIVYLAQDHSLERRVALKEYMPLTLASRVDGTGTGAVTVRSESDAETFQVGLRSFLNEARLLAQFDHPALVKVYRFWEANGTAYLVMPFYEGPTLHQALASRQDRPDEAYLRALLAPLFDALTVLHAAKCFHRDISPDNILLTATGPVLLDLGAARRAIGDATQTFTAILKDGYAPVEQCTSSGAMRQGPWTDIYALCGVVRYAIVGTRPTSAIDRLLEDRLQPLSQIAAGQYTDIFLRAIDAGLALKPEQRPQSILELRDLLDRRVQAAPDNPTLVRPIAHKERTMPPSTQETSRAPRLMTWLLSIVLAAGLLLAGYLYLTPRRPTLDQSMTGKPQESASPVTPVATATESSADTRPAADGGDAASTQSTALAPAQSGASSSPIENTPAVQRVPGAPGNGFPNAAAYYPADARRRGQTGNPVVRACVDESGRLTEAPVIERSSGIERLDEAALHLAKDGSGHYRPAMEDGHPVFSCFAFGVQFNLR
jgi:TonB family protein